MHLIPLDTKGTRQFDHEDILQPSSTKWSDILDWGKALLNCPTSLDARITFKVSFHVIFYFMHFR
jgi:hypothetical protein